MAVYVFQTGDDEPIKEFRRTWAAACKATGASGGLFHDLRRTAVRNLERAGAPETLAIAISGHRTRAIFHRYNIASEKDIREAFKRTQAHTPRRRRTSWRFRLRRRRVERAGKFGQSQKLSDSFRTLKRPKNDGTS